MTDSDLTETPQPLAAKSIVVNNNASMQDLSRRVSHEIASAEKRIYLMRSSAAEAFLAREQRLANYLTAAARVRAILMPRLEALRNNKVFNDLQQMEATESSGNPERNPVLSRTTTLTAFRCRKRPQTMEFSFRLDYDEPVKNVVIDYRLKILPIFIKFTGNSQLLVPFDNLDAQSIATWIDDRLVDFTRTYFEVYFHDEYQKQSLHNRNVKEKERDSSNA